MNQTKDEEARRLEAEQATALHSQQQVAAGTSYQQKLMLQPLLPINLWPHNYLLFSIFEAVIIGFMNPLTLPLTIPAAILAYVGHSASKKGKYSLAKTLSKVTLALLLSALGLVTTGWYSGWMAALFGYGEAVANN